MSSKKCLYSMEHKDKRLLLHYNCIAHIQCLLRECLSRSLLRWCLASSRSLSLPRFLVGSLVSSLLCDFLSWPLDFVSSLGDFVMALELLCLLGGSVTSVPTHFSVDQLSTERMNILPSIITSYCKNLRTQPSKTLSPRLSLMSQILT